MSNPSIKWTIEQLEIKRTNLAEELKKTELDLDDLKKPHANRRLVFSVYLFSAWKNEGEKDIEFEKRGTLKDAVVAACEQFKRINNRTDVQGSISIGIICPNGSRIPLSNEEASEALKRYKQ